MLDAGAEVAVFYRAQNLALKPHLQALRASQRLSLHPQAAIPNFRSHQLMHALRPGPSREMAAAFRRVAPDLVFVSQGNLGVSALGLVAARKARLPIASYIPMAHTFREMHARKARRRDLFSRYLLHFPDCWLTNSKEQITRLRARGARQAIHIVPNRVAPPVPRSQRTARGELGLAPDELVIGMVGRFVNEQKGCDIFAEALCRARRESPLRRSQLLFLGNGRDLPAIRRKLEIAGWAGRFNHIPWSERPQDYYAAFDLIAMPSHFEGVPMVMQEAIFCGVPLAASAVDAMGSQLPANWTCRPNQPEALLQLMEAFCANPDDYREPLSALQARIQRENSPSAFEAALAQALLPMLPKGTEDA